MKRVYKNDVIKITSEDILNAIASTLYNMGYNEVLEEISKERRNNFAEFIEEIKDRKIYNIANMYETDKLSLIISNLENISMYISDTYLVVNECEEFFKIGYLNDIQERSYLRVGKSKEIESIFKTLYFPQKGNEFVKMWHNVCIN